ncbi:MAG: dihydroneopterin aldolase [Chitinophagales bacterium]|nr:dihydroneopterin aldolase [Chitinophagales bacterium]
MWKLNSQCLSIHNIEIEAPIGVFDFEKKNQNKFLVSVDLWGDYQKSMNSDELQDTLDYQLVFDIAHEVLNRGGNLIEAAAQQIMESIFSLKFPLTKVRVYIQKLEPPLNGKVSDTSFELVAVKG